MRSGKWRGQWSVSSATKFKHQYSGVIPGFKGSLFLLLDQHTIDSVLSIGPDLKVATDTHITIQVHVTGSTLEVREEGVKQALVVCTSLQGSS